MQDVCHTAHDTHTWLGFVPSCISSVYGQQQQQQHSQIGESMQVNTAPKLVLLDVGMVAELTPEDQQNLVGFFKVCMHSALSSCDAVASLISQPTVH